MAESPDKPTSEDAALTQGAKQAIDATTSRELGAALSIRDVSKTYVGTAGPVEAISSVSVDLEAGEFLSVVGPSGCGKSTLLLMIGGLTHPTAGEIYRDGHRVTKPETDIGVVFQESALLDWRTSLENILLQAEIRGLPKQPSMDRARALMRMMGLAGFEDAYPRQLSGGMQQRVSICRALLHDPGLLLMDEPLGALDALTRDQMRSDLQRIRQESGKTVVFVTHSITEAVLLGDRVLVFSPRPAVIADMFSVELDGEPNAQSQTDPAFMEYVERIRSTFYDYGVFSDGPGSTESSSDAGERL